MLRPGAGSDLEALNRTTWFGAGSLGETAKSTVGACDWAIAIVLDAVPVRPNEFSATTESTNEPDCM